MISFPLPFVCFFALRSAIRHPLFAGLLNHPPPLAFNPSSERAIAVRSVSITNFPEQPALPPSSDLKAAARLR